MFHVEHCVRYSPSAPPTVRRPPLLEDPPECSMWNMMRLGWLAPQFPTPKNAPRILHGSLGSTRHSATVSLCHGLPLPRSLCPHGFSWVRKAVLHMDNLFLPPG